MTADAAPMPIPPSNESRASRQNHSSPESSAFRYRRRCRTPAASAAGIVITGSETIAIRMPMSSTSPRSPNALFAPGNLRGGGRVVVRRPAAREGGATCGAIGGS